MPTSWRRVAAAVVSAVCAAVPAPAFAREPIGGDGRHAPAGVTATVHLRMPALPLPAAPQLQGAAALPETRHTIVAGDTLWAIALSAGVRVDALAAANGLTENSVLKLGRVLTIPHPATPVPAPAASVRPAAPERTSVPSRAAALPAAPGSGAASHLALLWPAGGIVTSRFGWRVHPIFGGREFHTGMDIATRYGSPVVAACAGLVRFVGWKSGYGRIVVLDHDGGIETAYSHLSAALVSPGQRVTQGQLIGRIGNSGWSTGPHLFFEVRRNGVPLDPARYLN
ncbi:MAG TPA: M23 family metallopeptidase [bacterium]|nr:M23 family metallopeptidase [bacterium]